VSQDGNTQAHYELRPSVRAPLLKTV
jgi:hypothetical protein